MPQRIPTPTIPGALDPFVGVDQEFAIPLGSTLTGVFEGLVAAPSGGDAVVEIRDQPGGLGQVASLTFPEGERFATWIGSLDVSQETRLYLRVVSANGALGLQGQVELDGGEWLTTIEAVRQEMGKTVAPSYLSAAEIDALIAWKIGAVSEAMRQATGRHLTKRVELGEAHSPRGRSAYLRLHQYPVISVEGVRRDGEDLAADTDYVLDRASQAAGFLVSLDGCWDGGFRSIEVDYTHGFDPVPADLNDAAAVQTVWALQRSPAAGGHLGVRQSILEDGQTVYMVDAWAPQVLAVVERYTEPRV